MKVCRICKTEQQDTLFTRDSSRKSGYSSVCLDCNRIRVSEWKKNNPDKFKVQIAKTMKRWQSEDRNHKKYLSHAKVLRALKKGTLVRPNACSRCKSTDKRIHGHHYDYDKPLDVIWLCHQCHRRVHNATR